MKACEKYYYFLEARSQEDALLFATFLIEQHLSEFEDDFYDHLACMVFHDGNTSMLRLLLHAGLVSKNTNAKLYLTKLAKSLASGLQLSSRKGCVYDDEYLDFMRSEIINSR